MANMNCDEVKELLPALAFGTLDPDQKALVSASLDSCPGCRELFEEYIAVSEGLLGAVPQRLPPPAVKMALMERVQPHAARKPQRVGLADWLRGALVAPRWALAVAAVVIVAITAILGAQLNQFSINQTQLVEQMRDQQVALAVLAGPNTLTMNMTGTQAAVNANAVIHYNPQEKVAVLQIANLPPVPVGKTYQLWLIDADGKRESGALFNMLDAKQSTTTLVVWAPRPMNSYARCGVSIEPVGGSPQPTGPAVLTGQAWNTDPDYPGS